jgi:hypothetical protein
VKDQPIPGAVMNSDKSFEEITDMDLVRLAAIATEDREDFFLRFPRYSKLKLLCVALCQGAALHYVDRINGIKDFDVWTFFEHTPAGVKFPCRRRKEWDFGESKFGKHPAYIQLMGRRVDLIGRSIDSDGTSTFEGLKKYLLERRTHSARCLSEKAVVLLEPVDLRGVVIWPPTEGPNEETCPSA